MIAANVAIWLLVTLTVLGAWFFFRRWSLTRPPLGTVNLGDVGFTLASIVALPFLYLWLPGWVAGSLLAVTTLSLLWFLVEPVTPSPLARWGLAGGLVAADVLLAWQPGTSSTAFLLVNDAVIILVAIGVSVLWAQGGLRARDLAILAGAITLYDLVATGFLPLTTEMIDRLAGMPFLPMAAWPVGNGEWVGIGLGDLLMAAVAPLIFRKAFGKQAGMVAIAVALGIIAFVLGVSRWDALPETFPTMIVLGPMIVAQYLLWSYRIGAERTTVSYQLEDIVRRRDDRLEPIGPRVPEETTTSVA
ncbi:MAG TPA: hypothetical protein VD767_03465 [Thermomicrobiales bacterium]|nr:hypothetical protein [Thermomicrobiales bacterium]